MSAIMMPSASRCGDCGKLAIHCDCPTYDPYADDGETIMHDPVNAPHHYRGKTFEAIQIIEAFGLDHFRATALAYVLRHGRKNGEEDLRKAVWYLRRLAGSSLNLISASYCLVLDPETASQMDCDTIADDFGIDGLLREALSYLIPNPVEYISAAQIRADALAAADLIEAHLAELPRAELPEAAQ